MTPMTSRRTLAALSAAALVLGACTAATSTPTPSASAAPTASASTSRGGHQLAAGTADNGHTVRLAVGDTLVVTLTSTYWQFRTTAPPSVLHLVSSQITPATTQNGNRCVPGQGCGTNIATFLAATAGQATVAAARTTCGEAMLCTGGQGSFTLTVVVTPA